MWYALHVRSKRGRREMSMKRYTNRLDDGQAIMNCQDCDTDWTNKHAPKCTVMYCRNRLKDRVAAYEDTGLEPQEIERIVDAYGRWHTPRTESAERLEIIREIQTDRLRELVEADRDGRIVVLPCKVGTSVWRVYDDCGFSGGCGTKRLCSGCKYRNLFVEEQAFCLSMLSQNGKLGHPYYKTREAAEAALKGEAT